MESEPEPLAGGYTLALFGLGLVLGVLTIRVRHQQKLEERNAGGEIVVTQDFKNFQATFMSKCGTAVYHLGATRVYMFHMFLLLFERVLCIRPVAYPYSSVQKYAVRALGRCGTAVLLL